MRTNWQTLANGRPSITCHENRLGLLEQTGVRQFFAIKGGVIQRIDRDGRLKEESASEKGAGMQDQEIREQLRQWRRDHPQATFDEIDAEVEHQYAMLEAEVVAELSAAGAVGVVATQEPKVVTCPQCQSPMHRRGQRTRQVPTRRGRPAALTRDYYVCPACGTGLFPPG